MQVTGLSGAAKLHRDPPRAAETSALPPESGLPMPAQDLWRRGDAAAHPPLREADFWQIGIFLLSGALAVYGGIVAYNVLIVGGLSLLELLDLVLFQILFGWIAYALASALVGFSLSFANGAEDPELNAHAPLTLPLGRTAILMPIHNEEPEAVFTRLRNIDQSLRALGADERFHLFVLSDTRDPDIQREEWSAFERLRRSSRQEDRLFYRLRRDNHGRKAGNIADWVRRFGGAYDYMVVLDADSVMEGETLLRLAGFMDQQPRTALIQTVPKLVNRTSLYGRAQQFASRLYGPMLSRGLAYTSGTAGNYWGHNAIIRVAAFAAHAGLPRLPGPRPFGGEIMSHDFVEAALLRRAGWAIRLAPGLGGSYEECPPTLPDMTVRERRWCQGNLQHLPVIAARGLHWMSRIHLAQGVLTYLMPPIWLLFLVTGAALSVQAAHAGVQQWDDYGLDMLNWLLAISLLSLFAPRVAALLRALVHPHEQTLWGHPGKLIAGVACETILSALIAPIMMTAQTIALYDIVLGRDSGWPVQRRTDGSLHWRDVALQYAPHTVFGLVFGAVVFAAAPSDLLWLTPVILGLMVSIPLVVLTSDPVLGAKLTRFGLFKTPEEFAPPSVLAGLANPEPRFEPDEWAPRPMAPAPDLRVAVALQD